MFKKFLMFGLALLLLLGAGAQAIPVRALDGKTAIPIVPVLLKSVTLLRGFPPRIEVRGALPPGCYKLRVGAPVVGRPRPDTSIRPITIRVRAVQATTCTSRYQPFKTTISLDPFTLDLRPGRYVALVNPVKGQSPFQVFFTIPYGLD